MLFSSKEWRITVPTVLTILRITLVPFVVYAMLYAQWFRALSFFAVAVLTDVFDGWLARLVGDNTLLGAVLDPIADKLLVITCFFTLAFLDKGPCSVPVWFFIIVLTKEIILMASIVYAYHVRGYVPVKPVLLGKLAMCVQTMFIGWLLFCNAYTLSLPYVQAVFIVIVLIFVVAALVQYRRIGLAWFYGKR